MKSFSLRVLTLAFILSSFYSCNEEEASKKSFDSLFRIVPVTESKINFKNQITESHDFNFMNYYFIYNGGGVAVADINNDGLEDIYLTSNQQSNRMYLNEGNLKFKEVTSELGLADKNGWTTGVSAIDINADGWMDFYVCKSGSPDPNQRKNRLYINQQGKSFIDQAEQYGLADPAYSTQAYFFDFDKDNDLDMYLVNHRSDFKNSIVIDQSENKTDIYTTDKLYQNNNGRFTDISASAGIINKSFGHSASIYDFNEDGWLDIYVCNDFLKGDHLYINNGNGTFTDEVSKYFDHIPFFSMGSDIADINNDDRAELLALDMISEDHVYNKRSMAGMSTSQFFLLVDLGNHYQYMSNALQLNRGNGVYSEISQASGIANTDWSWAPLLADFDNDGLKDLFVTNGIKRDLTDNDFKIAVEKKISAGPVTLDELFEMIPSRKIRNYYFSNEGNTQFKNRSAEYGMNQNINSSGAAYADFDNDGDLDLIVNNLDDYASLYENQSVNNHLTVELNGPSNNPLGIGAELYLESNSERQYVQNFLNRGYLSSVSDNMIFGLGADKALDISLTVVWHEGKTQRITGLKANSKITLDYANAVSADYNPKKEDPIFVRDRSLSDALAFSHSEESFDDFSREILLPQKYSTLGPQSSVGDINGDGLDDIFFSGAKGFASQVLIQTKNGSFRKYPSPVFEKDKECEDLGSVFIDGDNDGDLDLYVVSGGNEHPIGSSYYNDRYYVNNGNGKFNRANNKIPKLNFSGYSVSKGDFDSDGDEDLFIGGRVVPGRYPMPARSALLRNDNGSFVDTGEELMPGLNELGMITDALFSDYDKDGDLDLILSGEWMGIEVMVNEGSGFSRKSLEDISGRGWWYSLTEGDFNEDGYPDYMLGNLGLNNKFGAKKDKEFHVFCNDFDESGNLDIVLSKESKGKLLPVRGRECSSQQMPFIKEKFPTYTAFAESDLLGIYGKDKIDDALHYTVNNFKSAVLLSDGNNGFKFKDLPMSAQYGPILSSVILDLNQDGHQDIVAAGNIYNAEVETVRYDASKGSVLFGDGKGGFRERADSGLLLDGNVKGISLVEVAQQKKLLVVKNNDKAELYSFNM